MDDGCNATQSIPILCSKSKFFGGLVFFLFLLLLFQDSFRWQQNTPKIDTLFDVRRTFLVEVECWGKQYLQLRLRLRLTDWQSSDVILALLESAVTPKTVWMIEITTRAIVQLTFLEIVQQKSLKLGGNLSKIFLCHRRN